MPTPTPEIICPRCRISVPLDKIGLKDRCCLKGCPLNEKKADE